MKQKILRNFTCAGLLALTTAACGGTKPPEHGGHTGPVSEAESSSKQRESVAITVYNQNFGLVREVRNVGLGKGRVSLEFKDVSAHIQPETVSIKSLSSADALSVLEQNYRYDVLTPQKLLEKYVGKKIRVYRYNEKTGKDEAYDAEVLAAEQGTVLKIGNEITYNFPGRFAFPEVPDNLIAKPTLVWLLDSGAAQQKVEISYLSQNLNWSADYVLVVDDKDEKGDLTGWVTLTNNSGTSYENATLKLVAGDVQRVSQQQMMDYAMAETASAPPPPPAEPQFHEEGFFEYHLYTLSRPADVLDKEQKQVTLLDAHDIAIEKKLIFFGAAQYYRGNYGQVVSNQKVGVYLDFENKKSNHMGMPLPKGVVRVYKADKSGAKQFIGEDSIDHTPRDEEIRIKMGEAFDVVGDRKQTDWKTLGICASESSWEIELRNHKDEAATVEVREPINGDWEILSESHRHKKEDAHTFTFDVNVPARGKTKVTYRVRVRWC
ncbi:MAG: DUF4139 domain-containing protein [Myxococcales bacterium]|nr:DUF4139 domain-containing protein [Myxococcales bacterium]MCB9579574.1 DUF4139 domain-containing protein [Polyangiaceae bacterium]